MLNPMLYVVLPMSWPKWSPPRWPLLVRKMVWLLAGRMHWLGTSGLVRSSRVLHQMPHHLQFNPWILTGYRSSDLSTAQCFQSLCYLHNETVNILTHGVPILYVVLYYQDLFGAHFVPHTYLTYCHMISCLSPWLGSFLYHVFMNHKSGKRLYSRLLQMDMAGIWLTQTFGALATLNASLITQLHWVRHSFVFLYLCLSLWALYKGLTALTAWQRASSFTWLVVMRVVAFVVRLCTSLPAHQTHLVHVVMQELWPILGAIISAARFPERFCPGYFDMVCNSHNIMHCLVVLGGMHMHLAFLTDIEIIYR